MGKYFGSELTSSKADIYNKSSIVSHPDNYSMNGLKQTWAWNRHIVGFYCRLDLCVNAQWHWESEVPLGQIALFHGDGRRTYCVPGPVTHVRHHSSPAQNMSAPFISQKKTPQLLMYNLTDPTHLSPSAPGFPSLYPLATIPPNFL